MKLVYDPNVFVTAVKSKLSSKQDKQAIEKAVNETAKYSVNNKIKIEKVENNKWRGTHRVYTGNFIGNCLSNSY